MNFFNLHTYKNMQANSHKLMHSVLSSWQPLSARSGLKNDIINKLWVLTKGCHLKYQGSQVANPITETNIFFVFMCVLCKLDTIKPHHSHDFSHNSYNVQSVFQRQVIYQEKFKLLKTEKVQHITNKKKSGKQGYKIKNSSSPDI